MTDDQLDAIEARYADRFLRWWELLPDVAALLAEVRALRTEAAGWNRQLRMQTDTSEELLAERDRLQERVATLELELKTMTGNRDRGTQVHRDTLAKWSVDRDRVTALEALGRDILREVDGLPSTPAEQRLAAFLDPEVQP